jgi:hypothetical protein
MIKNTDKIADK